MLYETVIINNKVKFLKIIDGIPSEQNTVDLSSVGINVTLKPRDNTSQPLPYVFKDMDEVRHFIDLARGISIEDLYNLVDSLCGKLLKISNKEKRTMITLDSIYSYFVDKFPTTHYDYFYAKPGSGKGAILAFLLIIAYRCVLGAGFTGAALLDLLGYRGTCQISLLEDEASNLQGKNADPFKIEIFKTGYDILGHTSRVLDGGTSGRNLRDYNTYGWKALAAEDKLDNEDLEGLSDRTFQIKCDKDVPLFYVKSITNELFKSVEKQKPENRQIIKSILKLRKLLLIFRMLHHVDIINETELNIDDRPQELTGPQIDIFNCDSFYHLNNNPKIVLHKKILPTLSKFLAEKKDLSKKTFEGIIYKALVNLCECNKDKAIPITDKTDGSVKTKFMFNKEELFEEIKTLSDGNKDINARILTFESTEFGKKTIKNIFRICRNDFEGKDYDTTENNIKVVGLSFFKETIDRLGESFEANTDIEIMTVNRIRERRKHAFDNEEDRRIWSVFNDEPGNTGNGNDDGDHGNPNPKNDNETQEPEKTREPVKYSNFEGIGDKIEKPDIQVFANDGFRDNVDKNVRNTN